MGRTRNGRKQWILGAVAALILAGTPAGAAALGGIVATPVGASGSTVYMSVTNTSLAPTTGTLNVSLTSGTTTIVGSTSVALAPLATATVPVPMSGTVSKLSLSTSVKVSIVDTDGPFCN